MLEFRENLPFRAETLEHVRGVHAAWNQLDRDLHVVLCVYSPRTINLAHSPTADQRNDLVRAYSPANPRSGCIEQEIAGSVGGCGPVDDSLFFGVRGEQRLDFR